MRDPLFARGAILYPLLLANVLPALDREVTLHRLQQDHARFCRMELISRPLGQQRHMAASCDDMPHATALRSSFEHRRALVRLGDRRRVQLDESNLDLAVHYDCRLVMRRGVPGRCALGADRFEHVLEIARHRDLLVRPGFRGHLVNIREGVTPWVVVYSLYAALLVVLQRTEARLIRCHLANLPLRGRSFSYPASNYRLTHIVRDSSLFRQARAGRNRKKHRRTLSLFDLRRDLIAFSRAIPPVAILPHPERIQ